MITAATGWPLNIQKVGNCINGLAIGTQTLNERTKASFVRIWELQRQHYPRRGHTYPWSPNPFCPVCASVSPFVECDTVRETV